MQIKDEVKSVLEFINYAYDIFGFTFELKLSTVCASDPMFLFIAYHLLGIFINSYGWQNGRSGLHVSF